MRMIILGSSLRAGICAAFAAATLACGLAGCGANAPTLTRAEQPLSIEMLSMLAHKGMDAGAPMFVRIFKEESELEVWKARDDGRFYHLKTYPICNWSGNLGPKTAYGDHQAPEGFYRVSASQMNPNSQYYLAFNLGYPNAYDRALERTGDALMVHGKCKSVGCYAMTDVLIEEIYLLARESLKNGQQAIEVHAFPFRMTQANMARFQGNPNMPFWLTLKQGYDFFEKYRLTPTVAVCERRYVVNVTLPEDPSSIQPDGRCPRFQRPNFTPFTPKPYEQQLAEERIVAPGPKTRQFADMTPGQPLNSAASAQNAYQPVLGLGAPAETGSTSAPGFSQ